MARPGVVVQTGTSARTDARPLFAATFCLFALGLYAWANPYLAAPAFWAEDGLVFWNAAYSEPFYRPFLEPYAGYLHLIPRLIAASATLLPYKVQPAFYAYASVAFSAWTAALVCVSVQRRAVGLAFALLMVVVPHTGEVWATPTNLQWIMACALPVIALSPVPESRFVRVSQLAFMVLAALTGPFMVLSAPLWAVRAVRCWRARDRHGAALVAIAAAGALVQLYFMTRQAVMVDVAGTVRDFPLALGTFLLRWMVQCTGPVSVLSLLFVVTLLGSLIFGRDRVLRAGCLGFGLMILFATAHKFANAIDSLNAPNADRYFFIPSVMAAFIWASLVADPGARWLRLPAGLLLLQFVFQAVTTPLAERKPTEFAANWRGYAHLIGKQDVTVTFPPNWQIVVKAK
ncbi:hypothetical protein [Roseixanthobacter pseudopolyaromaticivorans]|uniref:hypothetical protein n=1 Tax=Xanthobacteraceae TaxID=335928 RepID=UPI00372AE6C1